MGALDDHGAGHASLIRRPPARGTDTPLVSILEAWKAKLHRWCDEIIAALCEEFQEGLGDVAANGVHAVVVLVCVAAAVPKPARHRCGRL